MSKYTEQNLVKTGEEKAKLDEIERAVISCAEFLLSLPSHVLNVVPPHPDPKYSLHSRLSGPVPKLSINDLKVLLSAARRVLRKGDDSALDKKRGHGGRPRKTEERRQRWREEIAQKKKEADPLLLRTFPRGPKGGDNVELTFEEWLESAGVFSPAFIARARDHWNRCYPLAWSKYLWTMNHTLTTNYNP